MEAQEETKETKIHLCGCEKLCKIEGGEKTWIQHFLVTKIVGRLIMFTATNGIKCLIQKGTRQNGLVIYFIRACRWSDS